MKLREFDIDRDFDTVSRWFTLLGKTLLKKSSPPPDKSTDSHKTAAVILLHPLTLE